MQKVRIGEVAEIHHGFAFPSSGFVEHQTPYFLLTPGNFSPNGGFQTGKSKFFDGPVRQSFILAPGDILISMTDLSRNIDTLGSPLTVPNNDRWSYLHNQRLGKLIVTSDSVDRSWLYQRLRMADYHHYVAATSTGTTVHHTSPKTISTFEFQLPPVTTQRSIALLLGSLDDKIAANNEVVSASNELIRNLYRALPTSSRLLNDVASLAKNNEQPNQFLSDKRLIGLEHFDSKSLWLPHSSTPDTATSTKTKFQAGDTLFGKLRPYFHKVAIAPFDGYCSTDILVLRAKNPLHSSLVAAAANSDAVVQQAVNSSNGTRMPRAKWNDIESCPIPDPDAPATLEFIEFAGALVQDATARLKENITLAKTRDELLPLLMSGKITVREPGQEAEAAGAQIPSEENEV